MKIIYLGTPEFAIPPLEKIIEYGHDVLAVVTQPDRRTGRKMALTPPPLKEYAAARNIRVFQFEKISRHALDLREVGADIMVTCAYGQVLSEEIINICPDGIINIHASLLPRYRGAAPIQHAILNGDNKTGVTIMQTEKGLDTGDIILALKTPINPKETYGELSARLSVLGGEAVVKALNLIENKKAVFIKQDESAATKVKMLTKSDALMDFNQPAQALYNKVRAFNPWPCAYTFIGGVQTKIWAAQVTDIPAKTPGEILCADLKDGLIVSAADYGLRLINLQSAGAKRMADTEYLKGRPLKKAVIIG